MVFSIKVCLSLHKVLSLQKASTWFKEMELLNKNRM